MLQELFINFSVLVTLTTLFAIVANVRPELPQQPIRLTIHIGAVVLSSLVLLEFPLRFQDGVILAFHAVPIALAGLYGGLGWGMMTGLPLVGYRLLMGGAGAIPGSVHILLTALASGLLNVGGHGFSLPYAQLGWRAMLVFGAADTTLLLIPGHGPAFFARYGLAMMVLHSLGLLVCVGVLRTRFESQQNLSKVTRLAHLDHLTGLPNLRALEKVLTEYPAEETSCFLLIDVDHFKEVNDRFGHGVGDAVLRSVSAVMRKEIRGNDFICRYGGEEFAILLRGCRLPQAGDVAERIRVAVAAQVVQSDSGPISVTISGGLTALHAARDLPGKMTEADQLLYQAKAEGRNRIAMARSA
ncbi:MAG TPA: diguanylate cyclase [Symbiobacteriaceae bacterium]|nr:diguanylate cyclase [Symbiobacteriaceae bacterium]